MTSRCESGSSRPPIECEVGGELTVGRTLVLGERAVVHADVRTVDAVIKGQAATFH